ncbi:MAG: ATP-binding protein [Ignavibacteriae bacterium]|nr:MAG: ATP-binding protein [Ignavibacteriota bacterium]
MQKGEHAVLYGERGVGKTSLANMIPFLFDTEDIRVVKITCSKSDDFRSIWKRTLQNLKLQINKPAMGFGAASGKIEITLNELLNNDRKIIPGAIMTLSALLDYKTVFIFDEYDRIVNQRVKHQFADLIKDMSDNNDNLTLVIVGIGTNVNELIGDHPSIERCLKQVLMPKMSDEEIEDIISKGLKKLNMIITDNVKQLIKSYSTGFPHYTHLITKYSAKTSLQNENLTISQNHFVHAMEEILENINQSIKDAYHKAIVTSKKTSKFENVV